MLVKMKNKKKLGNVREVVEEKIKTIEENHEILVILRHDD